MEIQHVAIYLVMAFFVAFGLLFAYALNLWCNPDPYWDLERTRQMPWVKNLKNHR